MNGPERRMTYRLTSEWVGLKRHQPYPPIDSLNPNTSSIDWNACILIRLLEPQAISLEERLEFEFVGKSFRKDAPKLAPGSRVAAIPEGSLLSLSLPVLPNIFERQTAVMYGGCHPWKSSNSIAFHAIGLPFSDNSGSLKYVLVAISHAISKDAIAADDAETELMEYCDGDWSPLGDPPGPALIRAA
jgi:hypothetical protein